MKQKAEALAGRKIEVVKTKDGRYVVEWFSFDTPPPNPGKTEDEALENFIKLMEDTHESRNRFIDTSDLEDPGA